MRTSQAQAVTAETARATKHRVMAAGAAEDVAVLTLDEHGMILDCSRTAETLFKYRPSEIVRRHVSVLLPQLAEVDLIQNGEPNPGLRFLCRIGCLFGTVTQDGERFSSELFLTALFNEEPGHLLLIVRPKAEVAAFEER
jgi:PAS domain-containing protein